MKTRKWAEIRNRADFTPEDQRAIQAEVETATMAINLAALRREFGVTQVAMAEEMETTQSEVSKLEGRADVRLSTLRRYVQSLGGELELAAVVDGRRIKLQV